MPIVVRPSIRFQMANNFHLTRPQSLETGSTYLYREHNGIGYQKSHTIVRFLDYDPCPAIVIVQTLEGINQRCLREELFLLREIDQQEIFSQSAS